MLALSHHDLGECNRCTHIWHSELHPSSSMKVGTPAFPCPFPCHCRPTPTLSELTLGWHIQNRSKHYISIENSLGSSSKWGCLTGFCFWTGMYMGLPTWLYGICLLMQEARIRLLGWEDLLEKEMATHSSILAWKIPWMEEPGRLYSTGLQRVRRDLVTKQQHTHTFVCNLDSILKSRDIASPKKVFLVKAMVSPVVMNGCELDYKES